MLAVIRTGGKQYVVRKGTKIVIEKIDTTVGKTVDFADVLLVADGSTVKVGEPTIAGAKVTGTVSWVGKARKVRSIRYIPKKREVKRMGHRQPQVRVVIDSISAK